MKKVFEIALFVFAWIIGFTAFPLIAIGIDTFCWELIVFGVSNAVFASLVITKSKVMDLIME